MLVLFSMSSKMCKSVSVSSSGFIPGFKVWTLKAFGENGDLVYEISEDMGSNDKKFKKFCEELASRGYVLTGPQVQELSDSLTLNLKWDNNMMEGLGGFKKFAQAI